MSRQGPGCRHPALVGPETVLFAGCYHLPPKLLFDNMRGGNASFSRPAMKHRNPRPEEDSAAVPSQKTRAKCGMMLLRNVRWYARPGILQAEDLAHVL